jgi:hypothetical protein
MALTAHWIAIDELSGHLKLKIALIGFHHLKKKHTGHNVVEAILELLNHANISHKIGHFTLDNAKNNQVVLEELQTLLAECNPPVDFDPLQQHVQCFAHIINLCSSYMVSSRHPKPSDPIHYKYEYDSGSDIGDSDSCNRDVDREIDVPAMPDITDEDDETHDRWSAGIKRNSLMHAQRMIRFL